MDYIANRIRSKLKESDLRRIASSKAQPQVFLARRNNDASREFAHCESEGFFDEEAIHKRSYNWTTGYAVLDCKFSRNAQLPWMWIEIAPGPRQADFEIRINERPVLQKSINRRRCFRIRLSPPVDSHSIKIEILSNTFARQELIQDSRDPRTLGVLIGEICFSKYWWRNVKKRRLFSALRDGLHDVVAPNRFISSRKRAA